MNTKPQCPTCKASNVYFRIKTNDFQCRTCGKSFELRKVSSSNKGQDPRVIAAELSNAYSTNRYGNWAPTIKMLRRRGYSDSEIEAIIRKQMDAVGGRC